MTTTTTTRESVPKIPSTSTTSTEPTGARFAAAAGVAFVVLTVASTFAAGSPPASDASAAKIASYFHDHSGGIRAQLMLGGLGIVALLWWFGTLWRLLSRAEHERPRLAIVAAVGLATGLGLALLNGVVVATAALRAGDPATTRLFYTFSVVAIAAAGFGIGTFLFATSVVTYRERITPVWVSVVGFVAALGFYAGTIGSVTDGHGVVVVGLVAFFVWCVWILAVSATMWRSADTVA
jgi:Domain of unknown function (DUF4386)